MKLKIRVQKIIAAALCVMLLLLCGCTKKEPSTIEEMLPLAQTVCSYLERNDPYGAFRNSTVSLQYAMQEEAFVAMWESAMATCGPIVSTQGVYLTRWDSEESCIVDYAFDCEKIGLVVRFYFNEYAEMIYVTTYTVDLYDDASVPEGVVEEPFEITTEEGVVLHGVICLPESAEVPVPAALLLPGAGAADMDCSYGRVPFMRDIAYGLAQSGIASVRVNKVTFETTAISSLVFCIDLEYIRPYTAAYEVLAQHPQVDASQIYLLGHDLGGTIAPRLDTVVDSAGLILLGATARPLYELHYDQNQQYLSMHPEVNYRAQITEQLANAKAIVEKSSAFEAQTETAFGYNGYYYWEMHYHTPDLSLVTKPVFIGRGTEDFQNYDADWQSLMQGFTAASLTAKQYEGLSHLFTPSLGTQETTEYFAEAHVDSGMIEDIVHFILH